jgi:hypothetical protein
MKAGTFNARKKTGSLPYEEILTLAELEKIDYNWLLTGEGEMLKSAKVANDTPLIDRQVQMYLEMMMSLDENSRRDIFSAIEDKKFIAEMKQERQMLQRRHHAAMA